MPIAETESGVKDDELLANVRAGLADVSARLEKFTLRAEHQVSDAFIIGMGQDVLENVRGTIVLLEANIPQAAAASVRAAYECAQDMLLLAAMGAEYDRAGMAAYATELYEQQELRSRLMAGGNALGVELSDAGRRTADDVIAAEVTRLNSEAPGLGDLLSDVAGVVKANPKKYRKHWSTMGRRDIALDIEKRCPDLGPIGLGAEALYGLASIRAHPRLRTTERQFVREEDGGLTTVARSPDTSLLRQALFALQLSDKALTRAEAI